MSPAEHTAPTPTRSPTPLAFPNLDLSNPLVHLRPWTEADIPAIVAGFADAAVDRFSRAPVEPYTTADAQAFLREQEEARRAGTELHFACVLPVDATLVLGGVSLYAVELDEQRAAVGYWLAPDARGHGVATAAVLMLARWAFETLDVIRLELTCAPDNDASQAVARRCGFVREGVLRSHKNHKGARRDTVVFSLLRGELA